MNRRHATARQWERQRIGTMRRLWRAVEEFSPGGWGHEHLSSLSLLAANVRQDGRPLPWPALDGLARRVAVARLAVIDRFGDVAIELRRSGRADEALRAERLGSRMEQALRGVSEAIGRGGAGLDGAAELAAACRDALDLAGQVRSGLVGRVAVDLVPLVRWLVDERLGGRPGSERLDVDLSRLEDGGTPCVVLAGVLDLAEGLEAALSALLARGTRVAGGVMSVRPEQDSVALRLDWRLGSSGADPSEAVVSALVPLEAYGAVIQRLAPLEPGTGGAVVELRLAAGGVRRRPVPLDAERAAR
jgi:hypothetical protein